MGCKTRIIDCSGNGKLHQYYCASSVERVQEKNGNAIM